MMPYLAVFVWLLSTATAIRDVSDPPSLSASKTPKAPLDASKAPAFHVLDSLLVDARTAKKAGAHRLGTVHAMHARMHAMISPQEETFSSQLLIPLAGLVLLVSILVASAHCIKGLPICRSLPIPAMLSFALTCLGLVNSVTQIDGALEDLAELGFQNEHLSHASWLKVCQFTVLAVNGWALNVGLINCGFFREYIYGGQSSCNCFVKFLLGPFAIGISTLALWLTMALQLLLSHAFLVATLLIGFLSRLCLYDTYQIKQVCEFLHQVGVTIDEPDIDTFCSSARSQTTVGLLLCGGCLITVLSQALMLSGLSATLARVEEEMKKEPRED